MHDEVWPIEVVVMSLLNLSLRGFAKILFVTVTAYVVGMSSITPCAADVESTSMALPDIDVEARLQSLEARDRSGLFRPADVVGLMAIPMSEYVFSVAPERLRRVQELMDKALSGTSASSRPHFFLQLVADATSRVILSRSLEGREANIYGIALGITQTWHTLARVSREDAYRELDQRWPLQSDVLWGRMMRSWLNCDKSLAGP